MIKSIGKLTLATILAALVIGVPLGALAEDAPATNVAPAAPATPAAPAKPKTTNFRGTLGAVDKTAKTIEVDNSKGTKRNFDITSDTIIKRSGKAATLDDAVVGDSVSGSYTKTEDGKMVAKLVTLKPAATPAK